MWKLIRRLFYLITAFLGLYYFGNFRINDVNVRDAMQRFISPEKMAQAPQLLVENGGVVYRYILAGLHSLGVTSTLQAGDSADALTAPDLTKMMDNITPADREKMQELIKNNLGIDIDAKKLEEQGRVLEQNAQKALGNQP